MRKAKQTKPSAAPVRNKSPNRAAQRAARERVEKAVADIVDRAISDAFGAGMEVAAREQPKSHTGHYTRLFARALLARTAPYIRDARKEVSHGR